MVAKQTDIGKSADESTLYGMIVPSILPAERVVNLGATVRVNVTRREGEAIARILPREHRVFIIAKPTQRHPTWMLSIELAIPTTGASMSDLSPLSDP